MPVTSHQISGMIGGQNAMFGNNATYAQQISPFRQAGMMPTYQNPMAGAGMPPTQMPGAAGFNQGAGMATGMLNAGVSYGLPIMSGVGMAIGGRAGGMLDPMTAAGSSLFRSFGGRAGAGFMANTGNIAGGIARAGIGGVARAGMFAGVAAAPAMIFAQALKYAGGQMMEGNQFQNQVGNFLQSSFRFTNPASRTGMGFDTGQQRNIGRMLQNMGMEDVMTTPQELLSLMQRGTQMGVFRGVQDAREFRRKFKEMKSTLTEIASTFNTTLSEAMPFFQNARQMGFWTPQDISRHAQQTRNIQANTGMSAQQAQQTMAMGAQMVRGIGGTGQQGAEMMARAQGITGAALFGGAITSQQLGEAGMGTGARGAQNMGMMLAGASARFARSRVGRWALAAMMNKEGTGLDPERLAQLSAGAMSVGQMGSLARRNVSGRRAYQFVENEEELRGQLAQAGPQATLGIVRSLAGGRLYSGSARDKLITNRLIRRFMGGSKRQAKMIAEMARDMPRIMEIQSARSETALDMQERNREQMMNNRFERFKRTIGHWWEENISGPLQKAGADFGYRVGRTWERFTDRLMGTRGRTVSLSDAAVRGYRRAALADDDRFITQQMGTQGEMYQYLGSQLSGGGLAGREGTEAMLAAGYTPMDTAATRQSQMLSGLGRVWGGISSLGMTELTRAGLSRTGMPGSAASKGGWGLTAGAALLSGGAGTFAGEAINRLFNRGQQFSRRDIAQFQATVRASQGIVGESEAAALGFGGSQELIEAQRGEGARQIQEFITGQLGTTLRGAVGGRRLDAQDQRRYTRVMTQLIRSGAAGSAAQKMLEGTSDREAMGRVAALQGGARGQFGAVGMPGMQVRGDQNIEEFLEERRMDAVGELAKSMRGGISDSILGNIFGGTAAATHGGLRMEAITEQGIDEIRKDPRGEYALRLFARAEKTNDPKEKARLLDEARSTMRTLSQDEESGLSDSARSAAIRMQNGADPEANAIAKRAGALGQNLMVSDRHMFNKTIRTRRARLNERLRGEMGARLREAAGGSTDRLRSALEGALTGTTNVDKHRQQMTALAEAAAADPSKAARMVGILQQAGAGSSEVATVLAAAQEFGQLGRDKRMAVSEEAEEDVAAGRGRGMKAARRGITYMARQFGLGDLTKKQVAGLARGEADDDLKKRLRGVFGTGDAADQTIKELLNDFRGGITQKEFTRLGARISTARGGGSYSTQVAKETGLKPGVVDFSKKDGTMAEMGKQMKAQTAILRDSNLALNKLAKRKSGIVQDKKDKPE